MKFDFSFQKVLDVKEKEKEIAQQEFGTIKTRQMEIHKQMEGLEEEKEKVFGQYNHVHRKTVLEILEFQQEIEHVNRKLKQLESQSQQIEQEVDEKQQVLLDKSKEAKMWNQWKEKAKDAFRKEIDRQEQSVLDEMAVLRYTRRT